MTEVRDFVHRQSAHCESGVVSSLLTHHGLPLSEPMAFGIGSGLFFGYFPFVRMHGIPLTTFRLAPRAILWRVSALLGVRFRTVRFRDPEEAMRALDRTLDSGVPAGLQVGVYWLPYFPESMRFHFNMHNIIAFGRRDDNYLISEPCADKPQVCPRRALLKARFARGAFAPRGTMYTVEHIPADARINRAIGKAIRLTCFLMLRSPPPVGGVHGIRFLSRQVRAWPRRLGERRAVLYLAQVIRMMEEIGTGGAGFRFLYAAFLQEAAARLGGHAELAACSAEMTAIGDLWRGFAVGAARICKGRPQANEDYGTLADALAQIARRETALYRRLRQAVPRGAFR
jgi:hypothetical protein